MKKPLPGQMKIRAIQLDLARQMETLDYIKEFIDFSASFGYNALALYLEGRIRTGSFPDMPKKESYTPEEMGRIVEYAGARGMEVIPAVSNLGHVEQFLRFPRLARFAELRGGRAGRFGHSLYCACPSMDETYEFFGRYFAEVAAIFPSEYFHIGCDEAWDMGYCDLCRARLARGETQADLFAGHIRRTHETVAGKLGKTMVMWDDLYEEYPEALAKTPRDTVMCCWHYEANMAVPHSHFGNRVRQDVLSLYDRLGFRYFIAPVDRSVDNIVTFSRYALPHAPVGGWLTTWEKGISFMLESYPSIALAGRIWERGFPADPEAALADVCGEILGVRDRGLLSALVERETLASWPGGGTVEGYLRGPLTVYEKERARTVAALAERLAAGARLVRTKTGRAVMEDILVSVRTERIRHDLRRTALDLLGGRSGRPGCDRAAALKRGRAVLAEIGALGKTRAAQWKRIRPGIEPVRTEPAWRSFRDNVAAFLAREEKAKGVPGFLHARYFLPDQYGAQKVRFKVKFAGERTWFDVDAGVPKSNMSDPCQTPYFIFSYAIPSGKTPERIRIETEGYGGIGLTFVEAVTGAGRFVPKKIGPLSGSVADPGVLLVDDTRWCFLGEPDAETAYLKPELAEAVHTLEIVLGKSPDTRSPVV